MLKLHGLKVFKGSRKRRKVIGRGLGSGHGTYSTRGAKGQRARKSGNLRPGFEGGRQPLIRQVPKLRGFKSHYGKSVTISLTDLNAYQDGETVTVATLLTKKIIREKAHVKILASGTLKKKITVQVPVPQTAREAIVKAGGSVV